jgi:hypothetical protein
MDDLCVRHTVVHKPDTVRKRDNFRAFHIDRVFKLAEAGTIAMPGKRKIFLSGKPGILNVLADFRRIALLPQGRWEP